MIDISKSILCANNYGLIYKKLTIFRKIANDGGLKTGLFTVMANNQQKLKMSDISLEKYYLFCD